jgi:hypothetical protein
MGCRWRRSRRSLGGALVDEEVFVGSLSYRRRGWGAKLEGKARSGGRNDKEATKRLGIGWRKVRDIVENKGAAAAGDAGDAVAGKERGEEEGRASARGGREWAAAASAPAPAASVRGLTVDAPRRELPDGAARLAGMPLDGKVKGAKGEDMAALLKSWASRSWRVLPAGTKGEDMAALLKALTTGDDTKSHKMSDAELAALFKGMTDPNSKAVAANF